MDDKDRPKNNIAAYSNYLSLGTEIFAPILLGALVGNLWLDPKFGTTPLWTIILTLFGFVVGMYTLFKFVKKMNDKNKWV